MFKGIRARLLLSYMLLLLVTLTVTAAALVLILSARPATTQQEATQQLVRLVSEELREAARPLRARDGETVFTSLAANEGVRVITLDTTGDRPAVVEDSAGRIDTGQPLSIGAQRPLRDAPATRGRDGLFLPDNANTRLQEGSFTEDGDLWLFVRLDFGPERLPRLGRSVIVATQPPTPSLLQALEQFQDSLGVALLQAALVGGLAAVVMAAIVTRTIARPLQTVAEAAGQVAEGDYSQRVPQRGPREVSDVAQAFNRMSEQVQRNNQAQQDWLANISHDLKTPLTSIRGYAQAIQDGTAPDATSAAAIIHTEADRLNRLIAQLTELARLRGGGLSLRQDALDLGALVEGMAQNLDVVAQKKSITLTTQIQATPAVIGDGDQLAQVVGNLLSNALKYTPAGGQVKATVAASAGGVSLSVADSGVGIAPQDLGRVFERFYQVDKARGRGHGLGLAIAQEIVKAHGGRIDVQSAGRGQGTTFTVWLPVA